MRIEFDIPTPIRYRNIRSPNDMSDAKHLMALSGRMMQHHVRTPWWSIARKITTYISARNYARRSLEDLG